MQVPLIRLQCGTIYDPSARPELTPYRSQQLRLGYVPGTEIGQRVFSDEMPQGSSVANRLQPSMLQQLPRTSS